jgi:hypothetical protein
MRIQCPECDKKYIFSADELSHFKKGLFCKKCHYKFNRLKLLKKALSSEKKEAVLAQEVVPKLWGIATGLLLILLAFQVYFFEWDNLTQKKVLRPWLNKLSSFTGVQLLPYKNLSEFSLLYGEFEAVGDNFVFKTALTNQASFAQQVPSIKLILINYIGNPFAERIFLPEHYTSTHSGLIEPEASIEIVIDIAAPKTPVGGYRFELI